MPPSTKFVAVYCLRDWAKIRILAHNRKKLHHLVFSINRNPIENQKHSNPYSGEHFLDP